MNYKYILFDLDGTLTNPQEGITKSVQYALNKFGIEEKLDNLVKFIGPPLKGCFMEYYNMDEKTAEEAIEVYRERFAPIGVFENYAYDGIDQVLEIVKDNNKTTALATSKPQLFAEKILEKYNLTQYFDIIVGSNMDGTRSNKDEVIEEVFSKLNLKEEDKKYVLMVGDRKYDVAGANKCGIDSLGLRYGFAEENELEDAGATYIVDTMQDLQDFFK